MSGQERIETITYPHQDLMLQMMEELPSLPLFHRRHDQDKLT